jgi:hypothetical protein
MTTMRKSAKHDLTPVEPPEDEVAQKWIRTVWKDCRDNVGGIIKIGEHLIQAQVEVGYGRWGTLFNDEPPFTDDVMPFTLRDAERYMAIAGHPVLKDSTQWSNLPAHYTVLYVLSQIPERRLLELIGQGKVHSGMTRSDAERLVGKDSTEKRLVSVLKAQLRALEVIVEAMDNGDAKGLAVGLVQLVEDEEMPDDVAAFHGKACKACKACKWRGWWSRRDRRDQQS